MALMERLASKAHKANKETLVKMAPPALSGHKVLEELVLKDRQG
jgi:hypothetical protein